MMPLLREQVGMTTYVADSKLCDMESICMCCAIDKNVTRASSKHRVPLFHLQTSHLCPKNHPEDFHCNLMNSDQN